MENLTIDHDSALVAVRSNNLTGLMGLMNEPINASMMKNEYNLVTFVNIAVRRGYSDICRYFVETVWQRRNTFSTINTLFRRSALFACLFGHLDIFQYFVSVFDGESIDQMFSSTSVSRIVTNRPSNAKKRHPLTAAAAGGHLDICTYILDSGVDPNILVCGWSAMHVAARRGHVHIVDLLLKRRADPQITSHTDVTPLGLAVSKGHAAVVKLLLDAGGSQRDLSGEFETALDKSNVNILKVFLQAGIGIEDFKLCLNVISSTLIQVFAEYGYGVDLDDCYRESSHLEKGIMTAIEHDISLLDCILPESDLLTEEIRLLLCVGFDFDSQDDFESDYKICWFTNYLDVENRDLFFAMLERFELASQPGTADRISLLTNVLFRVIDEFHLENHTFLL